MAAPTHHFRTSRRSVVSLVALVAGCAVTWSSAIILLWKPILGAIHHGWTPGTVVKDWYLGDQFSYLTITTNVTHGLPAYREPLMLTEDSIYPSGYYWLLGIIGRIFGMNPFELWNIIGFLMTIALMVVAGLWMSKMSGNKWGWLAAPLPIVVSSLQYWSDHTWIQQYGGVQAVQWAAHAILFNPGTEQFSLTVSALALLILTLGFRSDGTVSMRHLIVVGVLQGLLLNAHSYIPLMMMMTACLMLLIMQLTVDGTRRRLAFAVVATAAGIGVSALHFPSMPLARFVVVLIGIVLPLLIIRDWRKRMLLPLVGYFAGAVICSLPLTLRLAAMSRKPDNYLQFRQHLYDGLDFSIPMDAIFTKNFPLFFLAIGALVYIWKRRTTSPNLKPWFAVLAGALIATTLLEYNAHWGFAQEAYRFFPYQMVFLAMMAAAWLFAPLRGKLDISARLVAVVLLALTLPTTKLFYDTSHTRLFFVPPQQQQAFATIGKAMPTQGAALTDICVPRKTFRLFAARPVADLVIGLALPANSKTVDRVLQSQKAGTLLDNNTLAEAGITSFVTLDSCSGPTADQLRQRFGEPIATAPLPDPAQCGLPAGAKYSIYSVKPSAGETVTNYSPIDPKNQIKSTFRLDDKYIHAIESGHCSMATF